MFSGPVASSGNEYALCNLLRLSTFEANRSRDIKSSLKELCLLSVQPFLLTEETIVGRSPYSSAASSILKLEKSYFILSLICIQIFFIKKARISLRFMSRHTWFGLYSLRNRHFQFEQSLVAEMLA